MEWLIQNSSPRCMRWIISIILKDIKVRYTCGHRGAATIPLLTHSDPHHLPRLSLATVLRLRVTQQLGCAGVHCWRCMRRMIPKRRWANSSGLYCEERAFKGPLNLQVANCVTIHGSVHDGSARAPGSDRYQECMTYYLHVLQTCLAIYQYLTDVAANSQG